MKLLALVFFLPTLGKSALACDPDWYGYQKNLDNQAAVVLNENPKDIEKKTKITERLQYSKGDCPSSIESIYDFEFRGGCRARLKMITKGYIPPTRNQIIVLASKRCPNK